MAEGDDGETTASLTVTLDTESSTSVSFEWATVDGTATAAGGDYLPTSYVASIAPGEMSKTITVFVRGDTLVEPDEAFLVRLSNAYGAELFNANGIVTITNDDVTPPALDAGSDASVDSSDGGLSLPSETSDEDGGCAVARIGSSNAGPMLAAAAAGVVLVLAARRRRRP